MNEETVKRYRCGWCGFPTDDEGNPLMTYEEADEIDFDLPEWRHAEHTPGVCCRPVIV